VVEKIHIPPKLQALIDKLNLTEEQIKFYASQEDEVCKRKFDCPEYKHTYYDNEGRVYCAEQYKFVPNEKNPYASEKRVCHKYLGTNTKEEQDYLF
jgi:hypothetical protein